MYFQENLAQFIQCECCKFLFNFYNKKMIIYCICVGNFFLIKNMNVKEIVYLSL